jgi:hypothetical protein
MATKKTLPTPKSSPAGTLGNAMDALASLRAVAELIKDIQTERTEQTRLREQARVDVERIHAMRDVLMAYLDRSFDERQANFKDLFDRLDTAIATGNTQMATVVLDSVVKLADSSPFKALRDISSARKALTDSKDWQF